MHSGRMEGVGSDTHAQHTITKSIVLGCLRVRVGTRSYDALEAAHLSVCLSVSHTLLLLSSSFLLFTSERKKSYHSYS